MSESDYLEGALREPGRKGPARALRRAGQVPGVVYGLGAALPVSVAERVILKALDAPEGFNKIWTTKFEGDSKSRKVMIKELDVHPLTDRLIHVDFLEIKIDKPLQVEIDIHFVGESKAVKEQGGELSIRMRRIMIEALPSDLVASIDIDVSGLEIGESISAGEARLPAKIKLITDPDEEIVAATYAKELELEPTVEEALEGEEGEEAAPPSAETDSEKSDSDDGEKK